MFKGSLVALVTPMSADLTLDWPALDALIEWHIEQGTHGIVAVGTTGESATLDVSEHTQVLTRVIKQVAGRIPVVAGTGANSTQEAILLTQRAKELGADGCLLVAPYYNKPTQEGLYQHHLAIAKAVNIPQLLYNVPGRTAVDMLPETVQRLSLVDNIIGIKEATGSIERLRDIKRLVAEDFILLSGDDATALEFMRNGGVGEISVTANVVPAKTAKICELMSQGRVEEAQALDNSLAPLHRALFLESNPIPVKWAIERLGLMHGAIRLPLTVFDARHREQLDKAMQAAGALELATQ